MEWTPAIVATIWLVVILASSFAVACHNRNQPNLAGVAAIVAALAAVVGPVMVMLIWVALYQMVYGAISKFPL